MSIRQHSVITPPWRKRLRVPLAVVGAASSVRFVGNSTVALEANLFGPVHGAGVDEVVE